ncbi:hypothetical protein [Neobacillus drentensis]|uniref:hypothetical protein n=1 Tax=Neobacillus drentensis TaxID=220684 RepID=UPI0030012563
MSVMKEINEKQPIRPFWKKKRFKLGIPVLLLLVLGIAVYKIGMGLASEKMVDELASEMTKEDYDAILKDPGVQQILAKESGSGQTRELLTNLSSDPTVKDALSNQPVNTANGQDHPAAVNMDSSKEKGEAASNKAKETNAKNPAANKGKSTTATENAGKDTAKPEQPSPGKVQTGLQFSSNQEVMKFLLSKFSMGELSALAKKAQGGVSVQEKEEIKSTVLGRLSTEEYNALKVYAAITLSKRQ